MDRSPSSVLDPPSHHRLSEDATESSEYSWTWGCSYDHHASRPASPIHSQYREYQNWRNGERDCSTPKAKKDRIPSELRCPDPPRKPTPLRRRRVMAPPAGGYFNDPELDEFLHDQYNGTPTPQQ